MRYVVLGAWFLAVPLAFCTADVAPVRLLELATVRHEQVWLSDLLPRDVSATMREAGEGVGLGRAPQPGSLRVFSAQQIAHLMEKQPELLRRIEIPSTVRVRREGWPVAAEAVRAAVGKFLAGQGRDHGIGDFDLPGISPLAADAENPALEVTGIEWDGRRQSAQVYVRCQRPELCGHFLVHMELPTAAAGPEPRERPARSSPSKEAAGADNPDPAVLIKPGQSAMLVIEDGRMRMALPVICLQGGVGNQLIRVFDRQSRRVFRAQVVGKNLLHATL